MTALSVAIKRRNWELVSLQLLLGVSEAASKLPPESLTALIDLLGGEPHATVTGGETRRRRRRGG